MYYHSGLGQFAKWLRALYVGPMLPYSKIIETNQTDKVHLMTRAIATHPHHTINCTEWAQWICQQLNEYMRWVPGAKFSEACDWFNRMAVYTGRINYPLSYTSLRRYYNGAYGLNQWAFGRPRSATLVRLGAKVNL